jgi:hypothetical protein
MDSGLLLISPTETFVLAMAPEPTLGPTQSHIQA